MGIQIDTEIAIVGGGIAGLAAAHHLTRIAPETRVTLIEQDDRLGGKIVTRHVDGFTIEGGPDSMLAMKPRGVGLCRELGLADELQGVRQETRRSFVLHRGRLHDLPEGLTGLVPTRLGPMLRTGLISPVGKARMAMDFLLPARKGDGDETLAAFIERRLGREVFERLVEPLMAGIYAGDGRQLSLAATFPQLRAGEREHGGLIKGVLAARRSASSSAAAKPLASPFVTPRGGLGDLVQALAARLAAAGVRIEIGNRVVGLSQAPIDRRFDLTLGSGESIRSNSVILATPAGPAAALVTDLVPEASRLLRAIPYVSTATVALAYPDHDLPRPLAGHGYVIPRVEGRQALACTWVSSKWAHRAPPGFALIRVFIGRANQEQALAGSDEELIALAQHEVQVTLGITAAPNLTSVSRWPDAMPQYTLGHLERVAAIEEALAARPGLALAGHAYRGVGIPDCIVSGERAAERVAQVRSAALST
jgi:oxygen-dependent protoporphyrinogen oxidase